jgi:putative hydrolase of the HAD superfamily
LAERPQALVFDLGGVLIEVDYRRALAAWAAAADVPVASLAARFAGRDDAYCAHERGELDDRGYFAYLRKQLGLALGDDDVLAGWNAIIGEPLAGIEPLVRRLAGEFPLYVFSNTNPAHISHFAPRHRRLLSHFRNVITSCEIGARKPEPEAFLHLAKIIGAKPEQLLFFDDLEENVLGARRAGLIAFQVTRPDEISRIVQNLSAR